MLAEFLKMTKEGMTPEQKVEALITNVEALKAKLEIPATIRDYGVSEKEFLAAVDDLAVQAFDDQCTGANPRYPLISEIKDLYLTAYYETACKP